MVRALYFRLRTGLLRFQAEWVSFAGKGMTRRGKRTSSLASYESVRSLFTKSLTSLPPYGWNRDMNAGEMVSANLRLVRPLGEGAMGCVWLADHLGLKTQVAVKFMTTVLASNPTLAARFAREATAAAQIRSPHVVQVLDNGITHRGEPYIVMELLEGEDLAKHIQRLGPLSLQNTTSLVVQVCRALSKAHQVGVIHRDIKPSNIFLVDVGGDLFAKILDFGIAKQDTGPDTRLTATHDLAGTPLYMSPEQFMGLRDVDYRTDLWSLAVVAYYALTGREPFAGATVGALSIAVDRGVFMAPSQIRPELPASIDVWFSQAFQKDRTTRFSSAREMAETLEQIARMDDPSRNSSMLPSFSTRLSTSANPSTLTLSSTTQERLSKKRRTSILAGLLVVGIATVFVIIGLVRAGLFDQTSSVEPSHSTADIPAIISVSPPLVNKNPEPTIEKNPVLTPENAHETPLIPTSPGAMATSLTSAVSASSRPRKLDTNTASSKSSGEKKYGF